VREKNLVAERLSRQQAIDALELLDHDSYLFIDKETNKPAVMYRCRGYSYGLTMMENGKAYLHQIKRTESAKY